MVLDDGTEVAIPSEGSSVIYTEKFFKGVLKALGYPIVHFDEIQPLYDVADIEDIIETCLKDWQQYFPSIIKKITLYASSEETECECPIENVMYIQHYAENSSGSNNLGGVTIETATGLGSTFTKGSTTMAKFSRRSYGTPFDYFSNEISGSASYQESFLGGSAEAMGKDYYVEFDNVDYTLKAKSAQGKSIEVELAVYDNDVDHINPDLQKKFLSYCQARLKFEFGSALSIMNSDLPLSFNSDVLKEDGKEELEKIEQWLSENSTHALML